tara:strand:- start:38 stop:253 length:216 start_codon:yes stop_codon:yes gene_type:complete
MRGNEPDAFDSLKISVGAELKKLRISAGYKSYGVFAWDNKISRIQYWKMEKVLDAHKIRMDFFFNPLFHSG